MEDFTDFIENAIEWALDNKDRQDYQLKCLAFVEDALSDDEEELITKEGRESIFVTMKSIIDCLTAAS